MLLRLLLFRMLAEEVRFWGVSLSLSLSPLVSLLLLMLLLGLLVLFNLC